MLDTYSRKEIVGWYMANNLLRSEFVLDGLNMAIYKLAGHSRD